MTTVPLDATPELAVSLMDLTSLSDQDTEETIRELAQNARTPLGTVAALCVCPRWVAVAKAELDLFGLANCVKLATVSQFPHGDANLEAAVASTKFGIDAGADEIDTVLPYRALLAGDTRHCQKQIEAVREACGKLCLKVILETGELGSAEAIKLASRIALDAGADFIKTSTGKVPVNATLEASAAMLDVLKNFPELRGIKIAGGVRTAVDAHAFLNQAANAMSLDFLKPETFRFGTSGLLGQLLTGAGSQSY